MRSLSLVALVALMVSLAGCSGASSRPMDADKAARLDPALLAVYDAHRSGRPVEDVAPGVIVVGEEVIIEATAVSDGAALADALVGVGLMNPAVAGVLVNGRLPIAALPDAAALPSLRSLRAVYRPGSSPTGSN